MATLENTSNAEVEEKPLQMVEDNYLEETSVPGKQLLSGSESNAIGSTSVVKLVPPECEKLGTLSSTAEEGTVIVSEPNATEPARVVKKEEAECENLGTSDCTVKEEMGNTNLVGARGSSVLNCGSGVKRDIMNGEPESLSSVFDTASTPSSSSSFSGDIGSSNSSDDESAKGDSSSLSSSTSGSSSSSDSNNSSSSGDDKSAKTSSSFLSSSTSGSSSGSSSSDDEADEENMISCGGGDFHDDDTRGPVRSKNEVKNLPPVPPVEVTIEPHHQMLPVGVIKSVIGAQVIVEGVEKHDPLNVGSVLWMTESRTPLGIVDEIFGPVRNPYYVVRYNSENEVPAGIQGGTLISFVAEFADHVLNNKDLYKKGYDASNDNDEELSDEAEFSDDEKEAEYKRMLRTTKRGIHDKNSGKRKIRRKEIPPEKGVVPSYPVGPSAPLFDHKNCPPYPGIGQGILEPIPMVPQLPPGAAGPDSASHRIWTNGIRFPQPSSVMLPDALSTHNSHQFTAPGIPHQQQIDPSLRSISTTLLPRVQPNIFAKPMYAHGHVGQNQLTFRLSSHLSRIQPPTCTKEQGYSTNGLQSGRSNDLHSSTVLENPRAPRQLHPGTSASQKREAFYKGGGKGWRPAR